jgi:hypothetical protein
MAAKRSRWGLIWREMQPSAGSGARAAGGGAGYVGQVDSPTSRPETLDSLTARLRPPSLQVKPSEKICFVETACAGEFLWTPSQLAVLSFARSQSIHPAVPTVLPKCCSKRR